jgi:hypothetical protein
MECTSLISGMALKGMNMLEPLWLNSGGRKAIGVHETDTRMSERLLALPTANCHEAPPIMVDSALSAVRGCKN